MCKSLMEFYQSQNFSNFILSVIVRKYNYDELKAYAETFEEGNEHQEVIGELIDELDEKFHEYVVESGIDESNPLIGQLKNCFSFPLMSTGVCIKTDKGYFDTTTNTFLEPDKAGLLCIKPLSDYYDEDELKFAELDGTIICELTSLDPIAEYEEEQIPVARGIIELYTKKAF